MPIYNQPSKLWIQIVGLLAIFSWVFITSGIVWFAIKKTIGIRGDEEHAYEGVDLRECRLEAYAEFSAAAE